MNSFKALAQQLVLWEKAPKDATMKECRAFAKKYGLEIPVGLPQSKEAFVAMFVVCHVIVDGWRDEKFILKDFPSLSHEHRISLFAYRNELDDKRHAKKVSKKKPDLKLVSSASAPPDDSEELPLPTNPKTSKPFKDEGEWCAHNAAAEKKFGCEKAWGKHSSSKPKTKKPATPQTWSKQFASTEAWHAHNQKLFEEFKVKKEAVAKKPCKPQRPKVSFEEDLQASLEARNMPRVTSEAHVGAS